MTHLWQALPYLVLFSFALLSCLQQPKEAPAMRPDIILCMADDQGWGDMGYNGHPTLKTPNFDKMASANLRFDRFYAAAPVCSPTRASVMTGRHPNRMGCFSWGRTIRPQEITIAERLQEAGYTTGHFGKWHLGSVRIGSPVNPENSGFDWWLSAPNFYDNDPIMSRAGIATPMEGESSDIAVSAAMDFIEKCNANDESYFAVIWFGSPHLPHSADTNDLESYADEPEAVANFLGEISGMDRALGKLQAFLKSQPGYDNTLLWYCSDNGGLPKVGSTGGRGRKGHIYEGGLRVPGIIQWPAVISAHQETNYPVNTSDIYPTLLEIVGIESESYPLDGKSILPLIQGKDQEVTPMGFWHYPASGIRTPSIEWMQELHQAQQEGNLQGDSSRLRLDAGEIQPLPLDSLAGHAAWLDWPMKLHRIQDSTDIQYELYNIEVDPMEENNIYETGTVTEQMRSQLSDWQESVLRSYFGEDYMSPTK